MKKLLEAFGMQSPESYAAEELQLARLNLLKHESAEEYHAAQAEMYRKRIRRLERVEPQVASGHAVPMRRHNL